MIDLVDPVPILDGLFEGAYLVDESRRLLSWNGAAEDITGYSRGEMIGKLCREGCLAHVDASGRSLCDSGCPLSEVILTGKTEDASVFLMHRLGHRVAVRVRALPMIKDGRIAGAIEYFTESTDLQDLRERTAELEKLSLLDPLTGAGNRRYAEMAFETHISEMNRYGLSFGVVMMDLDGLKSINDRLGHQAGDTVLRSMVTTLKSVLRPSDTLCRWGGDEFLAILGHIRQCDISRLAERFRALVASSSPRIDGSGLPVTISVGACLSRAGESSEMLLGRVDGLLYEAKREGGNRTSLREPEA